MQVLKSNEMAEQTEAQRTLLASGALRAKPHERTSGEMSTLYVLLVGELTQLHTPELSELCPSNQ